VLAYAKELTKTPIVVRNPPSFSPHAGTGPDLLRPGPVFAGIGGRVGDLAFLAFIDYMNTGRKSRCFEKQLRVHTAALFS
jgi:hypothetical protein